MAQIKLPVGIESFGEIRATGCYYIDKTGFIQELLSERFKVNLITRPRRFGKTLIMSMLADFLDIRKDSRELFEGLEISKNRALCTDWMNQYPVLFLTLKNVEDLNYEDAYGQLVYTISDICIRHAYLETSDKADAADRKNFLALKEGTASKAVVKNSLFILTRMMCAHFGKPVVLLVDEYDVPLARASERSYYDEMADMMRGLLGKVLKTNDALAFSVITGCLRIAKESIFTGTNNFVSNSISGERYSRYFGFMEHEVRELLGAAGFDGHAGDMKRWYDGYRFGKTEVYCPWDVLNYVIDLQASPDAVPGNYWKNTSHNGIIRSFIDRTDLAVSEKFEILLSGGCIREEITEDLTYDVLHSSESNLWSVLYLTGYLTKAAPGQLPEGALEADGRTCLRIPNEEIKSIFADTVAAWFVDGVRQLDRRPLFDAFWGGNDDEVTRLVTDMLFETISYFDYKEDYYHAFLAGIFAGAGYVVESNREYGLGRPDIVVRDRKKRRAIIIEVKHSHGEKQLEKDARIALAQMDTGQYGRQFLKGYQNVLCYGAAFFEKECVIRC